MQNSTPIDFRSSGLGLATVEDLLSLKASVAILDRDAPPESLTENNPRLKYFPLDITHLSEIEKAVEATVGWSKKTGHALAGVVNCAGVGIAAKVLRWEFKR